MLGHRAQEQRKEKKGRRKLSTPMLEHRAQEQGREGMEKLSTPCPSTDRRPPSKRRLAQGQREGRRGEEKEESYLLHARASKDVPLPKDVLSSRAEGGLSRRGSRLRARASSRVEGGEKKLSSKLSTPCSSKLKSRGRRWEEAIYSVLEQSSRAEGRKKAIY